MRAVKRDARPNHKSADSVASSGGDPKVAARFLDGRMRTSVLLERAEDRELLRERLKGRIAGVS
jgi:hypothetical protein